ncbi:class I SAM-dependent methyltransferase [Methylobacterium sp. WL69]|uniref:methyltransferase domain-containing protein n=1 Tax=Methylobacterium sp. WL69 TaxID=2603893 RepID=UPI0011C82003|nr:methyltransferase domain-containing protein [Methylobacterium sp. WL69]TXM71534.1 class I SAM-dependent methyltransferase [Methylobacterium sp. WL69]
MLPRFGFRRETIPPPRLRSSLCRQSDLSADWYRTWTTRIAEGAPSLPEEQQAVWGAVWAGMRGKWMHRKLWEWCAITQALHERGMLQAGRRGLGFAVGHEPLTSLFVSLGASVLASDLVETDGANSWSTTGQLAASKDAIHWPGLVSRAVFDERAAFQNVDMRDLSGLPEASFDFAWSSCSFEHLGSLEHGMTFVRDAMRLLRPGGLAVHTTEFNVSSNDETSLGGPTAIYRRKDIESLDRSLRVMNCGIERLDFDPGTGPADLNYDLPPYYKSGHQHLKLQLDGYVCTSILLIIQKG